MTELRIDPDGLIPIVEVIIGNVQIGDYTFALFDRNDRNTSIVRKGTSDDRIEDRFRLVRTREEFDGLDGFTLSWVIWIKARRKRRGQRWNYRIRITQGDETIAELSKEGDLTKNLHHFDGDFEIKYEEIEENAS